MKGCDEESLGRLIYATGQEMKTFAEKVLKPYGLTPEQLHIMKSIPVDSGMTQRDIGRQVGKSPANMTRILDRLESKSLVERRDNPEDRRASLVFLTGRGLTVVEEVLHVLEAFSSTLLQGISEKEQQVIRVALRKMSANLQNMSGELQK